MWITAFFVFLIAFSSILAIEDYCSVNQFTNQKNYMQFTKEASAFEYALKGKFKGLHCCAKGYRSIEWYKDGKPYPWHETAAPLIIYPESANQTVYTQTVTYEDAGNYTCVLRNDSVVHVHTIILKVYDKVPDDPKITYISQDTSVFLHQSVRLFCEAFVGRVYLPDAFNEAQWRKSGQNETARKDQKNVHQYIVSREDGQTFGAYLIIDKMQKEDFGEYICMISKPGTTIELSTNVYERVHVEEYTNPNPVPTKQILLWVSLITLLTLTALVLNYTYGLLIRVYVKDHLGSRIQQENKENDVLILYSDKDAEIVLGVLLPTLETNYNYKCEAQQLPRDINIWHQMLEDCALKSCRIVAVISPSCLNEKWDCNTLYDALKQIYQLDSQFCCITLKDLPEIKNQTKNSQGETLYSVIKNIKLIRWERSKDKQFWLSLRLSLPPRRQIVRNLNEIVVNADNSKRLNLNSLESMDVLM